VERYSSVAFALLALGCSASAVTAGGKHVRIERTDPPDGCEQISIITVAASNTGNDDESAQEQLRDRAAARGANYVRLDTRGGSSTRKEYTGTAFKCPTGT